MTTHDFDQMSLGQLLSRLSEDFGQLVRQEMELAKAEIREDVSKVGRAGGMMGGAAVLGYLALLLVAFAAAWGLSELIHPGWAFLIVAVVLGIAAAAMWAGGRSMLQKTEIGPERTARTVREDAEWAKDQIRR